MTAGKSWTLPAIAIICWCGLNLLVATVTNAAKTSIVMLLADDLGYGDVNYVNQANPNVNGAKTPFINEMAASPHTLRLTNFHMASTSCSPSRSSLISGRIPERECLLGANSHDDKPGKAYRDSYPFRAGMGSIAREAQRAGYATGFFGKWHIGPIPARGPGTMGFDTWVSSPDNIPLYDPACFESEWRCEGSCLSAGDACYRPSKNRACSSRKTCYLGHNPNPRVFQQNWSPFMFEPTGVGSQVKHANITRKVAPAEYVVDRFEEFAQSLSPSQPMFAYIWFHEPHEPVIAVPELAKRCADGLDCKFPISHANGTVTLAMDYYGAIGALDRAIGRVRTILQNLQRANDTILIFTSDNGPAPPAYLGGPVASPWPFTGYKLDIHEGSHRVSGLIEWPARISNNTESTALVSALDFYTTFLDLFISENPTLANGTIPVRSLEGMSLLPLLTSAQPANWTRPGPLGICQPIDNKNRFCRAFAWLSGKYRLLINRQERVTLYNIKNVRLYDIEADPDETTNLASTLPSVTQALFPEAVQWITNVTQEVLKACAKSIKSG